MKSITFGTLPDAADLPNEPFRMELVGDDAETVIGAINQGIDSHLEAVFFDQFEAGHKLGIEIRDRDSLRVLLRRLVELWDKGSEPAGDLASAILQSLDIEWV